MSLAISHFYRFGDFTVDANQKVLLRFGTPMHLTPKVFDTLLTLVENRGSIVGKEELMKRLWPDSFVEESNLTFNIQQLRKSLGDNARKPLYIETVSRRGYRFIADVEEVLNNESKAGHDIRQFEKTSLPSITGRESGSKFASMKPVALMAIVIVALAGAAGLILWKFSQRPRANLGEFMAALPLRLEKLTATGQSKYVAISPDGKYLAYTRIIERKKSIWLRQLTTNTNIQIVSTNEAIEGLAFAQSGDYLYFVSGEPGALYRVSLLGDVPVKIIDRLEGKFSISADNRHIAFVRQSINSGQQDSALMIANSDGTAERALVTRKSSERLDAPVWSPEGESIICASGGSASGSQSLSLVEVRVSNGTVRELSAEKFTNIAKIAWLPHQTGFLMSAVKEPDGHRHLWRVSYPKMEFTEITAGSTDYSDLSTTAKADKIVASQTTRASDIYVGESRVPENLKKITAAIDDFCWTPNRRLVYSSRASGNQDLWMMQPDGTEQRQLTVNAAIDGTPAVTLDNRYIVFMSNRAGVFQVWRMNVDGTNQVQLTNGGGKNFPTISPDGKWVLYNSTDNWDLWKISIDGGEPTRLYEHAAFFPSVSPDGKMIACLGRSESKAALLILPLEGRQLLKTFDLGGQNFSGNRIQWTRDGQALIYASERAGVTRLVKQRLSGGGTEEIMKFEDELFDFGYSPDGQMLAVTRGGWQHDIVLISDLNLR